MTDIGGQFYLAYTSVSADGYGVSLARTTHWQSFARLGMILAPPNKDCVMFPERVDGQYVVLHGQSRPTSAASTCGSASHRTWCIGARISALHGHGPGLWDSAKIGTGPPQSRSRRFSGDLSRR